MKSMGRNHYPCSRGDHRGPRSQTCHACALVALSAALLGACTLDTDPASPPTRASLPTQTELESPADHASISTSHAGAAGAPADAPTPAAAIASTSADIANAADQAPDATPEKAPTQAETKAAPQAPAAEHNNDSSAKMPSDDKKAVATEEHDSRCRPGKYAGVVNGTISLTGLIAVGTMAGTISLDLVPDTARHELLIVQNGQVAGVDEKQSKFAAALTGKVNCASGEIVETSVERGSFEDTTLDAKVNFAGAAKGQYSVDPPALLGTWEVSDETTLFAGEGTWSATMLESN
jgi:hypothetical protein